MQILKDNEMASFDTKELVDLIRHEVRVEDDTGFTSRNIQPASRRAKYGGLPLNFRIAESDQSDEDVSENFYEIPLYEEPIGTNAIIESRMRSRTVDSDDPRKIKKDMDHNTDISHLFVRMELPSTSSAPSVLTSAISRYHESNNELLNNPLREHAIYEASPSQQSKKILMLFPDQMTSEEDDIPKLEVNVVSNAKVHHVIAYCCYKYFDQFGEPLPGKIEDYGLYMAEENGEIDTDFPALERNRAIGDLGFPVLAMIRSKKQVVKIRNKEVTVYFPSGECYTIIVPSLDYTLSWLCDETLKLRDSILAAVENKDDAVFRIREYTIESVDNFGEMYKLENTIESTGCSEFVMVRKNSSRGEYHPRQRPPMNLLAQRHMSTAGLPPSTPSANRASTVFTDFPSLFEDQSCPLSPVSQGDDELVACFRVDRLHRYKPKWQANIIVRWNMLEVSPVASESERRRSFLPQQYQKTNLVPWEHICNVEISERAKDGAPIVTLSWLPQLSDNPFARDELSLTHIVQNYTGRTWKTVNVECRSNEDAAEIQKNIMGIVMSRESPAYLAYQFSASGNLSPVSAGECALRAYPPAESPTLSATSLRKKHKKQLSSRLSRMFTLKDKQNI